MPSQTITPVAGSASSRKTNMKSLSLITSESLNASLTANRLNLMNPFQAIPENDYTVPAPPPPSPVGFRHEHWPTSVTMANKSGVTPVCH